MMWRKLFPERDSTPRGLTIYLLHFARPFGHAQHYLGSASPTELDERIRQHQTGHCDSANLMKHVYAAGITFSMVRKWENMSLRDEYRLKNRGSLKRHCPICKGKSQ